MIAQETLEQVVTLHLECLPGSAFSRLGRETVSRFYAFVLRSGCEALFVEAGQGTRGAAVLSLEPFTLMRRFLFANLFSPAWLISLSLRPLAVFRVASEIVFGSGVPDAVKGLPEVVQIFAAATARRKGVGSRLLGQVQARLEQEGRAHYFLKTGKTPGNRALEFYKARGFERIGETPENIYLICRVGNSSGHGA